MLLKNDSTGKLRFGLPVLTTLFLAAALLLAGWAQTPAQSSKAVPDLKTVEKLAQAGQAEAQFQLGFRFDRGLDVSHDPAAARKWYRKAAEQGYGPAQLYLGLKLVRGEGGPQDEVEGRYWYRQAAEQGLAQAQYYLAVMFDLGKGGVQDADIARDLYLQAAEQGHPYSQYNLGVISFLGRSGPKDPVAAYMWFSLSGHYGLPQGKDAAERLSHELTPEQLSRAQAMVKDWLKKHGKNVSTDHHRLYPLPPAG